MKTKFNKRIFKLAPLASAVLLANPVFAQVTQLEEVIVTAQKKSESLQDVPISIVSLNSDQLASFRIDELTDIGASIPGLVVNPLNNDPAAVRVFIRGIGGNSVQITQDPSVALYMDGVYIGSAFGSGFEGVDVERMEILRGPQGTLYGRNSTGGALNVVTRRASTESVGFEQDFTGGNMGIFKSRTMVNLPLSDNFAVKINYLISEQDGYVRNHGEGVDFGLQDRKSGVVDLRWVMSDQFTADYRYERTSMQDSQRFEQVTELAPHGALAFSTDITEWSSDRLDSITALRRIEPNDLDLTAHTLHLDWELTDQIALKSITAYRTFDNETQSDPLATATGNGAWYSGAPYQGTFTTGYKQYSQEFQLLGSQDQFDYVVGAYFFRGEADWSVDQISLNNLLAANFSETLNSSQAAFGQVTYTPDSLASRLHITLGARYSTENRKAKRTNLNIVPTMDDARYDKDFSKFNPAVTVAWDIADTANIYGKIMTGFKSGGTSMSSPNATLFQQGFDEEEVISYEIGYKAELLDRRARINVAAFYTEMDGSQTSVQTGSAPSARDFLPVDDNVFQGFELDGTLLLPAGFTLNLAYSYLDTEVGEQFVESAAGITELVGKYPYAPRHSASGSLDYNTSLSFGELSASINYSYQDETFSSVNSKDNTTLPSYSLLGTSITLSGLRLGSAPGELKAQLWGKNLLDKEYTIVSTAAWTAFGASEVSTFGDPRTYGITLSYIY